MTRAHWWRAILALALLALAGCGRPGTPRPRAPKEDPPETPVATKMTNSTVRIADPKGKWTLEVRSKTMDAPREEGPYHLTEVEGQLQQPGQPSVKLKADRAVVDKQAERMAMQGAVRITRPGIVLEGERITYDLKTGKVLADAPTKTTIDRTFRKAGAKP